MRNVKKFNPLKISGKSEICFPLPSPPFTTFHHVATTTTRSHHLLNGGSRLRFVHVSNNNICLSNSAALAGFHL
jgi:hypothetical protein